MTHPLLNTRLLLIALFSLSCLLISAQNSTEIALSGHQMRKQVELAPGESNITLNGLTPGNTYTVKASRAVAGQQADFELLPNKTTASLADNAANLPGKKHALRFTATAPSVSFAVRASSIRKVTSVPAFLSVYCETCQETKQPATDPDWLSILEVTPNISAQSLITNTLIGGDCFTVENVTSSGSPQARGTFANGGTNIGIGSGMVMSSGRINILPGPNTSEAANGGFGTLGFDANLAQLVDGDLYDVNVIEFDFTPTANTVQFDFVFGSEEYCEYVGTEFNDAFGFFISGPGISGVQNLAVIPGTGGVPVTTNNVNHINNSNYYVNNSQNLFECLFAQTNPTLLNECQLDGWTDPLTATVSVIPCQKYHIKLAIADVTDELYDSAVFLRANSFNAGGQVAASPAYQPGEAEALEGANTDGILFTRGNSDLTQPLVVSYTVSSASTAIPGVDYVALPASVTIPAGQASFFLPITVLTDGLLEGQESIILLISNSCQCEQTQLEFLINDNLSLIADVFQDTTVCEGFSAQLWAIPTGGVEPFTFHWNTGESTDNIIVTPLVTTTYTVTITDAGGTTAIADAEVTVIPIVRDSAAISLCFGESIEINGQLYSGDTTFMDTTYTGYFVCGRITTYFLTEKDQVFGAETISFCDGQSVEIGGVVYNSAGTVLDTLSAADGCDSIVTYTLVVLPIFFEEEVVGLCPGETFTVNGIAYSAPGFASDTLTSSLGCDSVIIYRLDLLPQPTRTEKIDFCPGESITLGGTTYTSSATVTLTLPATTGCDTLATYILELQTNPIRAETIRFCPGESITLGGVTYTQPGTVVLNVAAQTGCDTIVTYTLEYLIPAPSVVSLACPSAVTIGVPSGVNGAAVTYNDPTATSNCPCPGIDLDMTSGLASGSTFPMGVTQVCYRAQDACGQTNTCCFNVTIEEDDPCDVKVIGCMKYELLTITQDQFKNKTYRIRVTNNCSSKMIYTAIQTPAGIVAMQPGNNAIYTAPSGNEYLVRNPNYTPYYSVRFRSLADSISNGESDILRYTLPAQAEVLFIRITSRLKTQQYYEAHLNTFYCPVGVTPLDERFEDLPAMQEMELTALTVFPNPSTGTVFADLSSWEGEQLNLQVFNSQGQRVLFQTAVAGFEPQRLDLPQGIVKGLYFLEVSTEDGAREVTKFMIAD